MLINNYWQTTDSGTIKNRLINTGGGNLLYMPYRLTEIDTGENGDTIAPAAPDTVGVSVFILGCTVSWSATNTNEEIGGVLTDLGGYKIYRSNNAETSNWGAAIAIVSAGVLQYVDTNIVSGETYYYRVTAFDGHSPYPNESWYSDSIACSGMIPYVG